ncbi:MAG TPA: DUF4124 domain-containing protein [Longimicrobiaceae bacterium]|nr:DUF4124 domain-containing protein [Longimicrobiaceae bacterium]
MRRLRITLLLAVLGGLLAFYLPGSNGRPRFGPTGIKREVMDLLRVDPGGAPGEAGGSGTVYKWRGADGTWHYSNVRPADHPEAVEVRGDVSWVKGSGAAPETEEGEGGEPRTAGELLRESRRLKEQTGNREAELEKLMKEAGQD